MIRVVFDAVGYVRSLVNPFSRWGRIFFDYADAYTLIVSPPLVREVIGTSTRQRVQSRFRTVAGRDLQAILGIVERATVIEITDEIQNPLLRDPKDNHILATAVAGDAEYIVTEDKDLLVLGTHRGIVICDAEAFLEVVGRGD